MFDTDCTMKRLWWCLASDFRLSRGLTYAMQYENSLLHGNMMEFRHKAWPSRFQAPAWIFRQDYQLENLFKRYIFREDAFTLKQLTESSFKKYYDTQVRLATYRDIRSSTYAVVQHARKIVKNILGEYDEVVHMGLCNFGKRATVGTPFVQSYLDQKASPPFTGTRDEQSWFSRYLKTDDILRPFVEECVKNQKPLYTDCDTLALTMVPKTFKSLRLICPNTDLGAFYTKGLGDLISHKLRLHGIDITRLQEIHKDLARYASKTGALVTADLSSASDSFTSSLIRRLVPYKWYRVLSMGRAKYVKFGNGAQVRRIRTSTFMPMGIGFTFPLQTLLFYALLKSISELTGIRGRISVYGDDLIYPRRLHAYVPGVFRDLGLLLNAEKTFSFVNFRESCGGDYFHGVDVRPFQPEGQHMMLNNTNYAVFCHKLVNGLLERWSPSEIPTTIKMLEVELIKAIGCLLQVPPSFPVTSGIRVKWPIKDHAWNPVKFRRDDEGSLSFTYEFAFIDLAIQDRPVIKQLPFYWSSLRGQPQPEHSQKRNEPLLEHVTPLNPRFVKDPNMLRWVRTKPPKYVRSFFSGRRLRKLVSVVSVKGVTRYHRQVGSIHSWI